MYMDEMLVDSIVKVDAIKKSQRRINTRGRYTLTLYNKFGECPEGFSQMAAHFDFLLGAKVGPEKNGKVKGVVEAIGKTIAAYDISQIRAGSLFVDAVEYWLQDDKAVAAPGEAFSIVGKKFFGKDLITKVLGFQFGAHKKHSDRIANPPPAAATKQEASNAKSNATAPDKNDKLSARAARFATTESTKGTDNTKAQAAAAEQALKDQAERTEYEMIVNRFSFGLEKGLYRASAWLVKEDLVDPDVLWEYLSPNETELRDNWNLVEKAYLTLCDNMNPDALIDNAKLHEKHLGLFEKALDEFNVKGGQKFSFLAANICMNNWDFAGQKLKNLEYFCRASEHVAIRKALAALVRHSLSDMKRKSDEDRYQKEGDNPGSSSRKEKKDKDDEGRRSRSKEDSRGSGGDRDRRSVGRGGRNVHSTRSSDVADKKDSKKATKSSWGVMLDPVGLHNQGLDSPGENQASAAAGAPPPETKRYEYGRGRDGYRGGRYDNERRREEREREEEARKAREAAKKAEAEEARKQKVIDDAMAHRLARNFMSDKMDPLASEKGFPIITSAADFQKLFDIIDTFDSTLREEVDVQILIWQVIEFLQNKFEAAAMDQIEQRLITKHLFPAISCSHNKRLPGAAWSVLQHMHVSKRHKLYALWEANYQSYPLDLAEKLTIKNTRTLLKRVVNNAEREDAFSHESHKHFAKLCDVNPLPSLQVLMKNLEFHFNVNMIVPYTDLLDGISELTADIVCFLFARKSIDDAVIKQYGFLDSSNATIKAWVNHLGEFAGRFFRRHPTTAVTELITFWVKAINEHTMKDFNVQNKCNPVGEVLLRVVIEKILEYAGGLPDVQDLTNDQLFCLAGSPLLRSVSIGAQDIRKEGTSKRAKARIALKNAFFSTNDEGIVNVNVLWYSLATQRREFVSSWQIMEWFKNIKGGGLKLLGFLFDGSHNAILQLTEFLAQVCTPLEYYQLMPPFAKIFVDNEPAMAWFILRSGLPQYGGGSGMIESSPKSSTGQALTNAENPKRSDEEKIFAQLRDIVSQQLPLNEKGAINGLSIDFYLTFWRLSLYDIYIPVDHYEKQENFLKDQIYDQQNRLNVMERKKQQGDREYTRVVREKRDLEEQLLQLQNERIEQEKNHDRVCKRLKESMGNFFVDPNPPATLAFVKYFIAPRVLTSESDALFCARFINLMIKIRAWGFQLLDFFNKWTIMLTQYLLSCTDREARVFGIFLSEAMGHMLELRREEKHFFEQAKDNPVFYRHYYPHDYDPNGVDGKGNPCKPMEFCTHQHMIAGHGTWESRLTKVLMQGLQSKDWQERRNSMLVISNSYKNFPMTNRCGAQLLQVVTKIATKDEYQDLKTLGGSLRLRLQNNQDRTFSITFS